jgi:virulence-associated protein VagC
MASYETKTFKCGRGVALQLPAAFGIAAGTPMTIEQRGDVLTIRPAKNAVKAPADEKRKLLELLDALNAIGGPPGGVQERDPFDFPERPGL